VALAKPNDPEERTSGNGHMVIFPLAAKAICSEASCKGRECHSALAGLGYVNGFSSPCLRLCKNF
jgi:hypothetical protein